MRPGVSRFRMSLGEMGPRGGRSTTTQAVSTCCLAALLCWWMPLRVTRYARYRAEVDPLEGDSQSFQGHFTLLPGLWADAGSRAWADCRWLRLPERPGDGLLLSRQEPSSELNGARALALALLFAHWLSFPSMQTFYRRARGRRRRSPRWTWRIARCGTSRQSSATFDPSRYLPTSPTS